MPIKSRSLFIAWIGAGIIFAAPIHAVRAQLGQVTIGTNPTGTHSYVVAGAVARLLQNETGIRSIIRPFSGSSVYMPLLHRGEITLGMNTNIDSYLVYNGREPYNVAMSNVRLLTRAFPLYMMYIVRGDSDLYRIEDLRDRRVVVSIRANRALEFLFRAILATGGLSGTDFDEIAVGGLADGMRLLTEGRVDAAAIGVDTAHALQAHATIDGGVRYLTMGQDESRLSELMPGAKVSPAPLGPVTESLGGVPRVSEISHYVNTGVHLAEQDAYLLTKTIHENWQMLRDNFAILTNMPPEGLAPADNPIPYHEGAIRYFREVGVWTEEHQNNQAELLE